MKIRIDLANLFRYVFSQPFYSRSGCVVVPWNRAKMPRRRRNIGKSLEVATENGYKAASSGATRMGTKLKMNKYVLAVHLLRHLHGDEAISLDTNTQHTHSAPALYFKLWISFGKVYFMRTTDWRRSSLLDHFIGVLNWAQSNSNASGT